MFVATYFNIILKLCKYVLRKTHTPLEMICIWQNSDFKNKMYTPHYYEDAANGIDVK